MDGLTWRVCLWNQWRWRWFHEKDFNICLLLVQITLWLGMAWEDEDSKEKALRDPARAKGKLWFGHRWTNASVKKRVPAFRLGTNQAIENHIVWRIKSYLDFYGRSDLEIWLEFGFIEMVPSHMFKMVLLKWMRQLVVTLKCWRLQEMAYEDIEASSGGIRHILFYHEYSMSYYYEWCNMNSLISLKCSD